MWVKLVFKRPVDDSRQWEWKVFGRHALGLRIDSPSNSRPKLPLLRGFKDKTPPNLVLEILEDNRPWMKEEDQGDLPGKYMPFGGYVLQGVRKLFVNTNIKADEPDKEALVQKREDQKVATQKFWKDFHADVSEFKQTYVQKILNQQSEVEAQKWLEANAVGQTGPALKQYSFLGS
jgi:hypothetical protein